MTGRETLHDALRQKARLIHGRKDGTFEDEAAANLMRQAASRIESLEAVARAAHKLTDDFVMMRVGPRNYEAFYVVRAKLSEALDD